MADERESVIIQFRDLDPEEVERWKLVADKIEVTFLRHDTYLEIEGPGLHEFLKLLDPHTWDPDASNRGGVA